MKEHLFRGKCIDDGEWIEGACVKHKPSKRTFIVSIRMTKTGLEPCVREVIPKTVSEYTGYKDKNGKKIFEGDIGKIELLDTKRERYIEICIGKFTEFGVHSRSYIGLYLKFEKKCKSGVTLKDLQNEIEIIGNIHDNPGLLK